MHSIFAKYLAIFAKIPVEKEITAIQSWGEALAEGELAYANSNSAREGSICVAPDFYYVGYRLNH